MQVVPEEFGIVVRHFFEVGDEPALIDGIAMEAAGQLIVDATAGHFFERGFGHGEQVFVFFTCGRRAADCPLIAFEDQIDGRGMGEFRGAAEAAVLDVKELGDGFNLGFNHADIKFGAGTGKDFGLGDGFGKRIGGALELLASVAVGLGDGEKNAAKTGAAHLVIGREIRASEKGLAVGKQKAGERPATLPGDGAVGGLVA